MEGWTRRDCMKRIGGGVALGAAVGGGLPLEAAEKGGAPAREKRVALDLADFQPRSMLHVPETRVAKPRFPVIDVHTHLTFSKSEFSKKEDDVAPVEQVSLLIAAKDALAVMERKGIRAMVNLTGGTGKGFEQTLAAFDRVAPGRFLSCVEPSYGRLVEPRFPQQQADAIVSARKAGARG